MLGIAFGAFHSSLEFTNNQSGGIGQALTGSMGWVFSYPLSKGCWKWLSDVVQLLHGAPGESRTIVATLNFPQLRRVKTLFEFSFSFFSFQNWNALGPNFGTALNIRNFYKYL